MQIAGHQYQKGYDERLCVLREKNTGRLLKPYQMHPRGDRETEFYSAIADSDDLILKELAQLTPKYFGTVCIPVSEVRNHDYIVLENLADKFRKPCIMDVKIGFRTWDPEASERKKAYEMTKYPFAETLGFRLLGIKVYSPSTGKYQSKDKHWGKQLPDSDIFPAFGFFFNVNDREKSLVCDTVDSVISETERVLAWFQVQKRFVFYSSSLLILYEGDTNGARGANTEQKMIDFTHVFPSHGNKDENYIEGIEKFLEHLKQFKNSLL